MRMGRPSSSNSGRICTPDEQRPNHNTNPNGALFIRGDQSSSPATDAL